MTVEVTIVVCVLILSATTLASQWMAGKFKDGGQGSDNSLRVSVDHVCNKIGTLTGEVRVINDKIKQGVNDGALIEKHLCKMLEQQKTMMECCKKLHDVHAVLVTLREMAEENDMDIQAKLSVTNEYVQGIKNHLESIEQSCADCYSEVASIDSRRNSYFGKKSEGGEDVVQ